MDYEQLLSSYRKLWVNRSLQIQNNALETLEQAIRKDILDEMTHPRLRKRKEDKLIASIKRIMQSNLSEHEKVELIHIHMDVYDRLIIE